jgi:hypothetical protein
MPSPFNILLLACYELGHQPLSLAWPTAVLRQENFNVTAVDLSISALPTEAAQQANLVCIAVPMHTALRLGVQAAQRVRQLNPQAPICFYGLYAWLNADYLLDGVANFVIAGEVERPLQQLAHALAVDQDSTAIPAVSSLLKRALPYIGRLQFPVPDRTQLPPLTEYARYMADGTTKLAGYVEASRGCLHTCRHCPVVPVYNGRFFIIPQAIILADIRQQVAQGAQHITFGDPDFLNGPGHALKVTRAMHAEFPHLTFDFTTKVEHILKHRHLFAQFRQLGCRFVVTAFESTSEQVLQHLQKGHTLADMETALEVLRQADIHPQPTWLPFTPWTTMDDYIGMLTWIRQQGLVLHVSAVQLSVRLLLPPHSPLVDPSQDWLGELDAPNLGYRWQHPDPCVDELQTAVAHIAEHHANDDPYITFAHIEQTAYQFAGKPAPHWQHPTVPDQPPPRLTEDWFC